MSESLFKPDEVERLCAIEKLVSDFRYQIETLKEEEAAIFDAARKRERAVLVPWSGTPLPWISVTHRNLLGAARYYQREVVDIFTGRLLTDRTVHEINHVLDDCRKTWAARFNEEPRGMFPVPDGNVFKVPVMVETCEDGSLVIEFMVDGNVTVLAE